MRENENLVFPLVDYQNRMNSLCERMQKEGLDYLLVTEPDNLCYLTGHETSGYGTLQALLVSADGIATSFSRLLEESNFILRTWVCESRVYMDHEIPEDALVSLLDEHNIVEIGLELDGSFLPRKTENAIRRNRKVINASGIVEKGRIRKSSYELDHLKKIAEITEAGMKAGLEAVKTGVYENELSAKVHHAMYMAGGEYPSVPPYIVTGPRCTVGHATWQKRRIDSNECVFLEMAGCLKRYHTAMMRTAYTGKPPVEVHEGANLVLEHLNVLKEKMKPGVSCHEIDLCTRDLARYEKIGATRISRTGYSLGIAFAPSWDEGHILSLVEGEQRVLEEDMVFHLIPWLQFPKIGAIMGLSETVCITKDGAKSFFDLPLEFLVRD